jgi:hypothetical protein
VKANRLEFTKLLEAATLAITDAGMKTVQSTLELATSAKSRWKMASATERKNLLNQLLSNPILDGLTVRYEIKKPFRVLSEMAVSSEWRPTSGSLRTDNTGSRVSDSVEKAEEDQGRAGSIDLDFTCNLIQPMAS